MARSGAPKTLTATIKLLINAGSAKPAPPVGPALGQAGLNIMSFCKDFNAKTSDLKDDVPVPVVIKAYSDKSFTYVMKSPPTSFFIKKAIGKDKGSGRTGHEKAGQIPVSHIYEIALIKQADLKDIPLQSICKSIVASCRSMGVEVVQGS